MWCEKELGLAFLAVIVEKVFVRTWERMVCVRLNIEKVNIDGTLKFVQSQQKTTKFIS